MNAVRRMTILALMLTLAMAAWGCGDMSDSDDDDSSSSKSTAQVCEDVADAIADTASRCGYDRATYRQDFLNGVANGDCSNIDSIRDRDAYYDDCEPALQQMSCTEFENGNFDPSCQDQLIRN